MINLIHLQRKAQIMREDGRSSASFSIIYNGHPFSNLFIDDYEEPTLYITSLGENPFTIKLIGNENFVFSVYLGDLYSPLYQYLELTSNKTNPFMPANFFEQYDAYIETANFQRPRPRDIARTVNIDERKVEDAKKIYFCGWHPLPDGESVSPLNFKKTCGLVGYEEAQRLRNARVSSNWTDIERKEALEKIANSRNY